MADTWSRIVKLNVVAWFDRVCSGPNLVDGISCKIFSVQWCLRIGFTGLARFDGRLSNGCGSACGIPRCRETSLTSRKQYCGRKCQLAAWPKHKAECGGRPVPRRKEKPKQKEEF